MISCHPSITVALNTVRGYTGFTVDSMLLRNSRDQNHKLQYLTAHQETSSLAVLLNNIYPVISYQRTV